MDHPELDKLRMSIVREIVEALRAVPISGQKGHDLRVAADYIEREFGPHV